MKSEPDSSQDGQKPKISILSILLLSLFFGFIVGAGTDKMHILPVTLVAAVILYTNREKIAAQSTAQKPHASSKPDPQPHFTWPQNNRFDCIVTARPYQQVIRQIVQQQNAGTPVPVLQACLIPDESNPFDSDMVYVSIRGHTVAFLDREQAQHFRSLLKEKGLSDQITLCNAMISTIDAGESGDSQYIIKLDLALLDNEASDSLN